MTKILEHDKEMVENLGARHRKKPETDDIRAGNNNS
jgi:hypothetical protein